MKAKVLQIPNYYSPHIGGIEKTCQILSEGLSDEYEVKVVCFSEDAKTKHEIINGIEVTKPGVVLNVARQALSLSYFSILRRLIKNYEPDIIHFHYPNPFVTALLLPLIPTKAKLYVQWHLDITKQKHIYPFVKPIETRLLKRADLIVPTSPNYRDSSTPLKPFLNKTDILASAINEIELDLNEEEQESVYRIKDEAKGKKIIFFMGRHVPHKGIQDLIEAEKLIEGDCHIFIGGTGPITEEVKKSCSSKRVSFLGRISDKQKRCYYHAADIFAFPSYTKAEGFGLTLAEAMYCKAVPVTYEIPGSGVNWVSLKDKTGLEVPNRDIKEYAKAIDRLLSDDDLRMNMAEAAHKRVVENFTVKQEIETLKKQYKTLI